MGSVEEPGSPTTVKRTNGETSITTVTTSNQLAKVELDRKSRIKGAFGGHFGSNRDTLGTTWWAITQTLTRAFIDKLIGIERQYNAMYISGQGDKTS